MIGQYTLPNVRVMLCQAAANDGQHDDAGDGGIDAVTDRTDHIGVRSNNALPPDSVVSTVREALSER